MREGLQIADITSAQSGSDLVLNWSTVAGSATIKGYYDNPAAWRFELDAGLSVPNAFLDNQAALSIFEEEQRAYQDTLNSDLLAIKQSPAPVTGTVWISVPQAGPTYDLLAYGDDLTLGIGYSGLAFTTNSTSLKHETTIAVNEIQGTADRDVLQPDTTETYQSYNQAVYLWLTDVTQTSDTTYTATIEKSSYTRPAFVPATELTTSGELYGNILRAQVSVSSETWPVTVIDAGAGDDQVGNPIFWPSYFSIAGTFHAGSFFDSDYTQTPLVISGGDGFDYLLGGARGDYLSGGNDDDWLFGYGGDDVLIGGAGNDLLEGYAGADRFVFDFSQSGHDNVYDNGLVYGR